MGDLDKTLQAIASLCPENIPELEILPVVELQVGDQCLLVWSEQKEVWRVKSFCADGDVDIVCEKFDAHMAVPKSELRLVVDYQQSKIEQLERENQDLKAGIKIQIELLEEASKSRIAYNERERNILKSQADDLAEILRGDL